MNDHELLAMAAKAAGFSSVDFLSQDHWANVYDADGRQSSWNPLTDDGDALRLAIKLKMQLTIYAVCTDASAYGKDSVREISDDPYAATRRVIVRAAAEKGKEIS